MQRDLALQNTTISEPELIDKRFERPDETQRLAQVRILAKLMDSAIEIPGLKIRIGLDALFGLLPGVGDIASSFVSLYIVQVANRSGVSRLTLARMTFNILCDWVIGSIPLAGDVFDIFWKANQRNVKLLLEDEQASPGPRRSKTGDWLFLSLLIALLVMVLVGSVFITLFLLSRLTRWIFPG